MLRGSGTVILRTAFGSWFQDVVLSCRGLRRRPGFVCVAVASPALGIGANALVFNVVDRAATIDPMETLRAE